jgi:hypothetical protein
MEGHASKARSESCGLIGLVNHLRPMDGTSMVRYSLSRLNIGKKGELDGLVSHDL